MEVTYSGQLSSAGGAPAGVRTGDLAGLDIVALAALEPQKAQPNLVQPFIVMREGDRGQEPSLAGESPVQPT